MSSDPEISMCGRERVTEFRKLRELSDHLCNFGDFLIEERTDVLKEITCVYPTGARSLSSVFKKSKTENHMLY